MAEDFKMLRCKLCLKDKRCSKRFRGDDWEWRGVCPDCYKFWEVGKKKDKLLASDGKMGHAKVILVLKVDGKDGDPKGATTVKSADIIAAMGAVKLKGTSQGGPFHKPMGTIFIGESNRNSWMMGASELVQVPEARAKAMAKIVSAVINALALSYANGFQAGRNILAGLAKGEVRIETFSELSDKAARGKDPRSWQ